MGGARGWASFPNGSAPTAQQAGKRSPSPEMFGVGAAAGVRAQVSKWRLRSSVSFGRATEQPLQPHAGQRGPSDCPA